MRYLGKVVGVTAPRVRISPLPRRVKVPYRKENRLFKKIGTAVATAALVAAVTAPAAQAGGSGDFYYGTCYSAKVGSFYIQGTNYDNSTGGQTYHVAMKGVPSGYTANFWTFNGAQKLTGALGGYVNFTTKSTDHTIIGYIKNAQGYAYYATLPASCWS